MLANPLLHPVSVGAHVLDSIRFGSPFHVLFVLGVSSTLDWHCTLIMKQLARLQSCKKLPLLSDAAGIFFKPLAEALVACTQRPGFRLELSGCDFESDCRRLLAEAPDQLYDRIYLNNVPDYTSQLPVLYSCIPLLRPGVPTSGVWFNDMTNCSMYTSMAHQLRSTLCLPNHDFTRRLTNAVYVTGNTWTNMVYRRGEQPDPSTAMLLGSDQLLPAALLQDYLKQLFLRIAVPPCGGFMDELREYCPLSLQAWVLLLDYLTRGRGYPGHLVSDVVEEILSGTIRGHIKLVKKTPNVAAEPFTSQPHATLHTTPFILELQMLLAVWRPHGIHVTRPLPSAESITIVSLSLRKDQATYAVTNTLYLDDPAVGVLLLTDTPDSRIISGMRIMGALEGKGGRFVPVMDSFGFMAITAHMEGRTPAPAPFLHVLTWVTLNSVDFVLRFPLPLSVLRECREHQNVVAVPFLSRTMGAITDAIPLSAWSVSTQFS